jgi:hypothetical protein
MDTISRRAIVKNAPLVLGAKTALAYQANSAVRFGIIGTGGRGQYVGTLMTNDKNARITAICDRYADRIDGAKTKVPGADKAATYRDYQKLTHLLREACRLRRRRVQAYSQSVGEARSGEAYPVRIPAAIQCPVSEGP